MRPIGQKIFAMLLCILAAASIARACSVPVFRYALERWPSDSYEILIYYHAPLSKSEKAIADALRNAAESASAYANVTAQLVNLDGKMDEETEAIWKAQKDATAPWVVVRYPHAPPQVPCAWSGPLNSPELKTLIDSPKRREIASRLLKGDSVVWLLIESGDKAKDDAALKLASERLKRLEKLIELPKVDPDDPDIQGPKLKSSLPLKLAFSQLSISRNDPAEKTFITTILRSAKEGATAEPIIVPIFGRGRALTLIAGKDITIDNITEAAQFLTGECSCQVKEMNPGVDLLLAADWQAIAEDEKPKEPKIPEIP